MSRAMPWWLALLTAAAVLSEVVAFVLVVMA